MSTLKQLKKYPIIALFFVVLMVFTLVDLVKPDKEVSQLENRKLAQAPTFTFQSFYENRWTYAYGEYVRDQFLLRDEWVSLQALLEAGQGKLELNGVWLADDGYQIAKNDTWSTAQETYFPTNIEAVGLLAARYPGMVQAMVVPSPANVLAEKLRWNPPQIDENALMDEMFATLQAAGVKTLDVRGDFAAANTAGTQLYYRTDHHWTTDGGARLAYEMFCRENGLAPALPDAALRMEVDGFFGTNYAKTKLPGTLADTLVYYNLPNAMTLYDATTGEAQPQSLGMMDTPKLQEYDKYAAFLHGNNGYAEIEGSGQGSILVIKDSYANCFVPYLTQSYAKVGVIDLRMWLDVDGVVQRGGYDSILVLYSFASFSSDTFLSRMMA